ncbi:MAG: hypothetical protein KBS36_00125, partial [Bacteroidales bacterium]|nr:hypothetical protein [Candidatus Cryptobacteroides fimicaballi]
MNGNSGCSVGSPSPEKVIESIGVPFTLHSASAVFRASLTSRPDGNVRSSRPSQFHPHSQEMQSKFHSFTFLGR